MGHDLNPVKRGLHRLDDVFPPDDIDGFHLAREDPGHAPPVDAVALALQLLDLGDDGTEPPHVLETVEQLHDLDRHLTENAGLFLDLRQELGD